MYRRLMIAVTALALGATVAGCGGGSTETGGGGGGKPDLPAGSTAKAIQDKGKLVVGTKFDQPGFGNVSLSDQPEGFDVEVGRYIARQIFGDDIEGKVEFIEAQTPVREEFIQQGKVDLVVATYSITDARKEKVDFAGPYLIAGQGLLVKQSDNSVSGPESLSGKKVCGVRDSTPLKRIMGMVPDADYSLLFNAYADCVEALKDGRVEVVTTDDQILAGFAAENPGQLKVVGKPFSTENYGVGVKKGDTGFRAFVNDQLQKMNDDGAWAKAYTDTIGAKAGTPVPPFPAIDRY